MLGDTVVALTRHELDPKTFPDDEERFEKPASAALALKLGLVERRLHD